jgi:hypothetical protein
MLGLLAVAGCDTIVESQSEEALWKALDIRDYQFVYSQACFCGFTGPNPAKLTVKNGVVVKVEATGTATLPPTTPAAATYPTIDSLFAIVEKARKAKPASLDIDFDPTYHYPTSIAIDPVKNAVDDEVTYRVESFTPSISLSADRK